MRFLEFILGTLIVWLVGFVVTALLGLAFTWSVDTYYKGEVPFWLLEVIYRALQIIVYTGLTTYAILFAFNDAADLGRDGEKFLLWLNIIIAVALGVLATVNENQYELITTIIMNIACVVAYIVALVCTPESFLESIRRENKEKRKS